jgi:preprotein translocase subunit SecG
MINKKIVLSGLKWKIVIPVFIIMLLSFFLIILIILSVSNRNTNKMTEKLMTETNQHYAGLVQSRVNAALNSVRALKPIFETNKTNERNNRDDDISN